MSTLEDMDNLAMSKFNYTDSTIDLTGVNLIIKDGPNKVLVNNIILDCKNINAGLVLNTNNKVYEVTPCSNESKRVVDGKLLDEYIKSKISNNILEINCIELLRPDEQNSERCSSYVEHWTCKSDNNSEYNYRIVLDEFSEKDYIKLKEFDGD